MIQEVINYQFITRQHPSLTGYCDRSLSFMWCHNLNWQFIMCITCVFVGQMICKLHCWHIRYAIYACHITFIAGLQWNVCQQLAGALTQQITSRIIYKLRAFHTQRSTLYNNLFVSNSEYSLKMTIKYKCGFIISLLLANLNGSLVVEDVFRKIPETSVGIHRKINQSTA